MKMAQKRIVESRQSYKMLQDRGAFPKEEGDVVREYKAMHEENVLSSWLREHGKNKEERIMEADKETKEETGKKRIREEEKEESWGDSWDDPCVKSDCDSGAGTSAPVVPVVTDVTDVPVSPSSVVTEVCDGFLLGSDWDFVEPQSLSFSIKRARVWTGMKAHQSKRLRFLEEK